MNDAITPKPDPEEQEAATVQQPAEPVTLDLEVAKLTDVGRARPHNEDYVDYYVPPDPQQLARKGAIYLVADGMGGHQAGEVASRGAVELVTRQYYADTTHDIGTSLVRAFRAANQQIHAQSKSDASKAGMGTTLVAVVILGRKVYVANVGDSRAYLINSHGITQITEDHSWVEEQVRAGLLTPEQARRHPQRNLVTRALGSKPDVQVDLFEGELNAGDSLLLCSDGLTGRVEDRELMACVRQYPPKEAVQQLVNLANERGGNDNITVLVVGAQQEMATVKAPVPVPVPIEKRETRKVPLVPILGGIAAILVLVLGGLLVTRMLLPPPGETDTPTPTIVFSPTVPPDTVTVEVLPPPTWTVALTSTATLSPTQTLTPTMPTATLMPTMEPTIEATQAPPTATETPTNTPEPSRPQPTLLEPPADIELYGLVTFKWTYPARQLGLGNAFEVRIWKEGTSEHLGAAEPVRAGEQTINLDDLLPSRGGLGRYFWTVVVVRKSTGEELSLEAESRPFTYIGPPVAGGSGGAEPKPTDDPSEKPTPAGGVTPSSP